MALLIRRMKKEDVEALCRAFAAQGWPSRQETYLRYFSEQESGARKVFVAELDGEPAGYATLLPEDPSGPYKGLSIPMICDFNVLKRWQRRGVGTGILDAIEEEVRGYAKKICLGVGLHSGYGTAQRMYVKRGYIPDGSGVWYQDRPLEEYAPCVNDDDLVLYLSKDL